MEIKFYLQHDIAVLADDGTVGYADHFVFNDISQFAFVKDSDGTMYLNHGSRFIHAIKESEQEIRQILHNAGCTDDEIEKKLKCE